MRDRFAAYLISMFILAAAVFFSPAQLAAQNTQAQQTGGKSEKVEYKADESADPFAVGEQAAEPAKPVVVEKKPLPPLEIQGLIWGGNLPQAIVNNKVVRVGDTIDSARVTDINKEGIWFSYDGQSYNLTAPGLYSSRQEIIKKQGGGTNEEQN